MAKYLGAAGGPKTTRRYEQAVHRQEGLRRPRTHTEQLPPDVQAMCQWTIEAFEQFFLAFSPHDYFPKHARSWVEAFLRERNLLLNVPPGHAKSEFFMIWVPTWLICRDRNVQILMVSNSAEDAATWALEVSGQLEHNEDLIKAFGRFAPETTGDQRWQPAKGVFSVMGRTRKLKGAQFTMESRGMTGRVLGRRADFVIVDDPTKQEEAESETERKRALKHLQQQVFTRAEPQGEWKGGRIAVIGQRVHLLDMYGALERQEWERGDRKGQRVWHCEKFPAVLDWDKKKVLWPERFPWDEIEQAYARVGGHAAFETMYQQNPVPEGDGLVTEEWIENCRDRNRPAFKGHREDGGTLPVVRVLSIDPSPKKFNGIVVGDLFWDRDRFTFAITEVHRVQAKMRSVQAIADEILDRARPDYFIFEESGFLHWVKDDPWFMAIKNRVRFLLHHTGVNKNSMEYGVQSLAGDFEFGNLSFPYGDDVGRRMTDMLTAEALVYPHGDTTDLLMALWFVKFNYKKLAPIRALPTKLGNRAGPAGGWSWLKGIKDRKNTQDDAYRRFQLEKARAQQDQRKVSVG